MKGNVLRLKNLPKNNEWCDKDRVLLYACFQILLDFIEQEKPQRIVDYKHNREQRPQWKELLILYRYWKKERPRMMRQSDRALMRSRIKMVDAEPAKLGMVARRVKFTFKDKAAHRLHNRLDDKLRWLDDEMLQRLVNMRHHLWC